MDPKFFIGILLLMAAYMGWRGVMTWRKGRHRWAIPYFFFVAIMLFEAARAFIKMQQGG